MKMKMKEIYQRPMVFVIDSSGKKIEVENRIEKLYRVFDEKRIKNDGSITQNIDLALIAINSRSKVIHNFAKLNEYEKLQLIIPGENVAMDPGFRTAKQMINRQLLKYKIERRIYITPKIIYIGSDSSILEKDDFLNEQCIEYVYDFANIFHN